MTTADSLQGVLLKYGISMADLRKANQMWPSDSIHLQKSLNISVNKTSKLRQLDVFFRGGSEDWTVLVDSVSRCIRKIPALHLLFFPQEPPSDVPLANTVVTKARRSHISGQFSSGDGGLLHTPLSLNSSSIFSTLSRAFLITKDTIMSRLSLDSGGTPPKEGQEHEMGVVGRNYGVNNWQRLDVGVDSGTTGRTSDQGLHEGRWVCSHNYDDAYGIGEERECAPTVITSDYTWFVYSS